MMNNFKKFSSSLDLAKNLAKDVSQSLEKSIKQKGKATLLLSGGNTPKLFLQELSKEDISWEKVIVGLVDERWIDSFLEDSNAYLLKQNLLINKAINANFLGLYFEEDDLKLAEKKCSELYKKEFQNTDVLILGMGTDGHTASLFPENEKLKEAFDLENKNFCISISPKTAPYERMSLTLKSILDAKNIILHIEGETKLEVYNSVLEANDSFKYPINSVLTQSKKEIEVYFS